MPNPRSDSLLDLTAEPLLFKEAQALRNAVVHRSSIDTMAALAEGGVAREPILGGPHDPPPLPCRHRKGGVVGRLPPLHLDEGEPLPFSATRSISPTGVL